MHQDDRSFQSIYMRTCEDTEARDRYNECEEYASSATEKRPAEIERDGIAPCDRSLQKQSKLPLCSDIISELPDRGQRNMRHLRRRTRPNVGLELTSGG
jgi:hypothetical protein